MNWERNRGSRFICQQRLQFEYYLCKSLGLPLNRINLENTKRMDMRYASVS